MEEREDNTTYKVVVNHEEQYSIWPADRENPLGWTDAGKALNLIVLCGCPGTACKERRFRTD